MTKARADVREDTGFTVRSTYERRFAAGDVVYEAGQAGESLYVIQSGHVELMRTGPDGEHLVARYGPGDFFGEIALIQESSRAVTARA